MYILIYLLVSFIIIFINYKRHWENIINNLDWVNNEVTDHWIFWKYFVLIPLFWIVIIPIYYIILFAWKGLDFIYNKYFEK